MKDQSSTEICGTINIILHRDKLHLNLCFATLLKSVNIPEPEIFLQSNYFSLDSGCTELVFAFAQTFSSFKQPHALWSE